MNSKKYNRNTNRQQRNAGLITKGKQLLKFYGIFRNQISKDNYKEKFATGCALIANKSLQLNYVIAVIELLQSKFGISDYKEAFDKKNELIAAGVKPTLFTRRLKFGKGVCIGPSYKPNTTKQYQIPPYNTKPIYNLPREK